MSDQKTFYFAYGSNMSKPRLERRIGTVHCHGRARLDDYCHRFSKRGRDGSAKGNVERAAGARVWGVLYELEPPQLEVLAGFETGYRAVDLSVTLDARSKLAVRAASFEAIAAVRGLEPTPEYLRHYLAGFHEHDLPASYRAALFADLDHILSRLGQG